MEALCGVRIEAEVELVGPAEVEASGESRISLRSSGLCLPDVDDDVGELGLEAVGEGAVGVEAGDEEEVADAGGEGERRGFDVGRGREMLDWRHGANSIKIGM